MPVGQHGGKGFRATVEGAEKSRAYIVLPFDPAEEWGSRRRYHVAGAIEGCHVRGALAESGKGYLLPLGPAWRRSAGLRIGDTVSVTLHIEGPQRQALAADIAAALAAEPEAAQFFDGLATFYRKGYLRWIEATKRSPDSRAARIAELVSLLKAGHKERPS